jgi:hypothetical protein
VRCHRHNSHARRGTAKEIKLDYDPSHIVGIASGPPPETQENPVSVIRSIPYEREMDRRRGIYVDAWNGMAGRIGAAQADLEAMTDRARAGLTAVVTRNLWPGAFAKIEASAWACDKMQRDRGWSFVALLEHPHMLERLGG